MSERNGIPVIVVTQREDDVEAISRSLRNAGQAAHCQWVQDSRSLPDVLSGGRAQLLFVAVDGDMDRLAHAVDSRDRVSPGLPLLALDREASEAGIARAMADGAQDLVTLQEPQRLSAVAVRELRAYWTLREVKTARAENTALQKQLAGLIDEAADGIIYVSEGIIANVNPAWLELFGYADATDLTGTPILDVFAPESRAAIKGALVACNQG